MRDGWRRGTFADLVDLDITKVRVEQGSEYPIVGVLGFGRGLLRRDPVTLDSTRYQELHQVHPEQLVYSKLKAFEGAITVVPVDEAPAFASPEFPTFSCTDAALPSFVRLLTQQPKLWDDMAGMSKGVGGRRTRLNPKDFPLVPVLVPPLVEQRRIVDLIGALDAGIARARRLTERANAAAKAMRNACFSSVPLTVQVGDVYDVAVGKQLQTKSEVGDFHPYLRAGNIGDGCLDLNVMKQMRFTPTEIERLALQKGDVVIVEGGNGYGKSAVWNEDGEPTGLQNHVLRVRPLNDTEYGTSYAFQWARWCHEQGRFKRTGTGIPNLGVGKVREMKVPDHGVVGVETLAGLEAVDEANRQAEQLCTRLRSLRSGLLTALLSGEHEIPDSYDELLAG